MIGSLIVPLVLHSRYKVVGGLMPHLLLQLSLCPEGVARCIAFLHLDYMVELFNGFIEAILIQGIASHTHVAHHVTCVKLYHLTVISVSQVILLLFIIYLRTLLIYGTPLWVYT